MQQAQCIAIWFIFESKPKLENWHAKRTHELQIAYLAGFFSCQNGRATSNGWIFLGQIDLL